MDIDAIQQDKTKFNGLCYNCNKPGHRAKECFRNKSKDRMENKTVKKDKDKKDFTCNYCGKHGHIAPKCFKKERDCKKGNGRVRNIEDRLTQEEEQLDHELLEYIQGPNPQDE